MNLRRVAVGLVGLVVVAAGWAVVCASTDLPPGTGTIVGVLLGWGAGLAIYLWAES